jgi:hypothetical protein
VLAGLITTSGFEQASLHAEVEGHLVGAHDQSSCQGFAGTVRGSGSQQRACQGYGCLGRGCVPGATGGIECRACLARCDEGLDLSQDEPAIKPRGGHPATPRLAYALQCDAGPPGGHAVPSRNEPAHGRNKPVRTYPEGVLRFRQLLAAVVKPVALQSRPRERYQRGRRRSRLPRYVAGERNGACGEFPGSRGPALHCFEQRPVPR